MNGEWRRGLLVVAVIFLCSAAANVYGVIIVQNAVCHNWNCTEASQHCTGSGACTYCIGNSNLYRMCAVQVAYECSATGHDIACGKTYSGNCVDGVCTGFTYVDANCSRPECEEEPPPEP